MKLDLEEIFKAYEVLKVNESLIPESYRFLLKPEFAEELEQVKDQAERIMMAAQTVGEQVGPEKFTEDTVEETVQYLKEIGLIEEQPTEDKPEETASPDAAK